MLKIRNNLEKILNRSGPTRERYNQNGGVVVISSKPGSRWPPNRYKAAWECPLDAYLDKGVITEKEHRTGIQFREAYYGASLSRLENEQYPDTRSLPGFLPDLEQVIKHTLRTLSPKYAGTIIDVCGYSIPITDCYRFRYLKYGLSELMLLWSNTAIELLNRKF